MTVKEIVNSNHPVQVMFYDGEGMCPGIMWGDMILCACCGATFEVDKVLDNAKTDGAEHAIVMFDTWVDISDEIAGDIDYHNFLADGSAESVGIYVLETEDK